MIFKSLDGATATGDGATWQNQNDDNLDYGSAQVTITGTSATVKVWGRLSGEFNWEEIHEFTASGIQRVTLLPQMKMEITAITAATVYGGFQG